MSGKSPRVAAGIVIAGAILACPLGAAAAESPSPSASLTSSTAQTAGNLAVPDFSATAWVLADLDSGAILAQQEPHTKLRPASTLKLLTALTVLQHQSLDQLYRADIADESADGNRVVLYKGLTYHVSDLLHAALMPSANDAAMALAKANGGARQTVSQMQAEASRLGLTDTTVANPSGLDAEGQFTSAADLAAIGRAALANEEIVAALKLRMVDFPGKSKGKVQPDEPIDAANRVIYPIYSHNRLLINHFAGVIGGKSGYTTLAHGTFVGGAERGGHRLLVSLMYSSGNVYTNAAHILDWGFENYANLPAVAQLPQPTSPASAEERTVTPLPAVQPAGDFGGAKLVSSGLSADEASGAPSASAEPASTQSAAATDGSPQQTPVPSATAAAEVTTVTTTIDPSDGSSRLTTSNASAPGRSGWLTLLTVLGALLAAARTRVYWRSYRAGFAATRTTAARNAPTRVRASRTGRGGTPVLASISAPGESELVGSSR
ncbi:MAG: serine hydrolase [Candidatus Nanopelagicales bacterium]